MIPISSEEKLTPLATVTSSQTSTIVSDESNNNNSCENDETPTTNTTTIGDGNVERIDAGISAKHREKLQQVVHALEQQQQQPPPPAQQTIGCRHKEQDNKHGTAFSAAKTNSTTGCPASIQIFSGEKPEKFHKNKGNKWEPERVSFLGASAVPVSGGEENTDLNNDVNAPLSEPAASIASNCTSQQQNKDGYAPTDVLTSLLARVDKVKREADLLSTNSIMPEGETVETKKILELIFPPTINKTESLRSTCYDSDSSGLCWTPKRKLSQENESIIDCQDGQANSLERTQHILQHLAQRRNDLRDIDKQLSIIMTQYFTKLESNGWSKELLASQYGSYLPLSPQQPDYQRTCPNNQAPTFADANGDAIDLTLVNSRLQNLSPSKEETKKPPVIINLKKSRLLGIIAANHSKQDEAISMPPINAVAPISNNDNSNDQLLTQNANHCGKHTPFAAICRSSPATLPNSTHTFTTTSTSKNTTARLPDMDNPPIYYLDLRQSHIQKQQQLAFTSDTGNVALNATSSNLNKTPLTDQYHEYRQAHNKKFRSNQPAYNDFAPGLLITMPDSRDNIQSTNMLSEAEIEVFNQSQALRQQQQMLLSEFYTSHHLPYAPVTLLNEKMPHLLTHVNSYLAHDGPLSLRSQHANDFDLHRMAGTPNAVAVATKAASDAAKLAQSQLQKIAYRCHVCGSGFEDRHRLQQHLSIHLNLDPSWFEERTIKETMAQYESKRGDYLCDRCDVRFETTADFDRHMGLHGEKPHRCDLCSQDNKSVSFRYYRQLLTHLRSHCFIYSCRFAPECKQTANRKDYLKLHILKHHLNNKLPEQYTICCH